MDDYYDPVFINGDSVERVSSLNSWGFKSGGPPVASPSAVEKAQQRLFFLLVLKDAGLPPTAAAELLPLHYRGHSNILDLCVVSQLHSSESEKLYSGL